MIRVLLVDDQTLFREGLATLLSIADDVEVVGEAGDGEEALEHVDALRPDVVLMDLRMPRMGGVEATRRLVDRSLGGGLEGGLEGVSGREAPPKILVLTTFDDDDDVVLDALRAGASGFLLKDSPSERLLDAIRTVARGDSFLQPSITAKVLAELQRAEPRRAAPRLFAADDPDALSERELEILRLVAQGLTNKAIAARLHLAGGTVKNYVTSILAKLGVRDRTQAALAARDRGLA